MILVGVNQVLLLPLLLVLLLLLLVVLPATTAAAAPHEAREGSCDAHALGLACDGATDDTAKLQAGLHSCAAQGQALTLPAGRTCMSFPLTQVTLPSHATLQLASGAVLKAGKSIHWPNATATEALPFLSAVVGTTNLSIIGNGTLDGSGAQWWTGSNKTPRRPYLLHLPRASFVLLQGFLLLNGAAWHTSLSGDHYRIFDVKIRSPPYKIAPNTDGLDISASYVHIRNADIMNGDDSICMKSPAKHILVENSLVRQGNGLVIGTSDDADFTNITFRNCTAIETAFGCHIKFKDEQVGHPGVSGILFENITILHPSRYAIGIDQNGQGVEQGPRAAHVGSGSNVSVTNVTYRHIRATLSGSRPPTHHLPNLLGGLFTCNPGHLACTGIVLDDVQFDSPDGKGTGCVFNNVYGHADNATSPRSCHPPANNPVKVKSDDSAALHPLSATTHLTAVPAAVPFVGVVGDLLVSGVPAGGNQDGWLLVAGSGGVVLGSASPVSRNAYATMDVLALRIDLSLVDLGASMVNVTLTDEGRVLARTTAVITLAPPKEGLTSVALDRKAGLGLFAGKLPLVPFGAYIYDVTRDGDRTFPTVESPQGLNLVAPYISKATNHTEAEWLAIMAFLDNCSAVGMRVHYHINVLSMQPDTPDKWSILRTEIMRVKDHPAILAYYIADEPGGSQFPPASLEKVYKFVKALDPHHPMTMAFCCANPLLYSNAFDIGMMDP
jgi:hypothetical protein